MITTLCFKDHDQWELYISVLVEDSDTMRNHIRDTFSNACSSPGHWSRKKITIDLFSTNGHHIASNFFEDPVEALTWWERHLKRINQHL